MTMRCGKNENVQNKTFKRATIFNFTMKDERGNMREAMA